MVLDHIHYFFEFTGVIPQWFSMVGRLSAPLFLFCVVEGFIHTHNRKKYFLKIYGIAIGMGILQYIFIVMGPKRPDGFYPQNQIFASFAILLLILQGIDWCSKKYWGKGLLAIIVPTIWPFMAMVLVRTFPILVNIVTVFHYSFLPMHTAILDGGTIYILIGVLLYLFRNHRRLQVAVFFTIIMFFYGLLLFLKIPELTVKQWFFEAYEWMGAFAGIFMLLYNGERGKGSKRLFYWFYPAHVYILFALSWILYIFLN